MTRTVRATVEYDGTGFAGFQRQAVARTVQSELEAAIAAVTAESVRVTGAGRTDAGVHAIGQVVSFSTDTWLDDATLARALNARLPADVAVHHVKSVATDFDARRCAVTRTYEYRIIQRPVRPTLDRERGWHVARPLDLAAMRNAADRLVGIHDFRAFAVGPEPGTVRHLTAIAVWREGDSVFVRMTGNAFLQRMVRRIVGTLVRIGRGSVEPAHVTELLRSGERRLAGPAAPAYGLTLRDVSYEGDRSRYHGVLLEETVVG